MRNYLLIILSAIFMTACGSSTYLENSYTAPNAEAKRYTKIAVMSMTPEFSTRDMMERAVARNLEQEGIDVVTSAEIFPGNFFDQQRSREDIERYLRDNNIGALLTVNLYDVDEESYYRSTTPVYNPVTSYPYYNTWYDYYGYWYPRVYNTGYITTQTEAYAESNLYDVGTGTLIWSSQSTTVDPQSVSEFADSYASEVADELSDQNIIPSV